MSAGLYSRNFIKATHTWYLWPNGQRSREQPQKSEVVSREGRIYIGVPTLIL